jgi:hypothetical protein
MARVSEIGISCRGGFRGPYVDVGLLIENRVEMNIEDFAVEKSCVKDCDSYCRMQLRIGGRLYVTWHSSAVLMNYLMDCRTKEQEEGVTIFPIEQCNIVVGDDRSYYLADSTGSAPGEREMGRMVERSSKNGRRR